MAVMEDMGPAMEITDIVPAPEATAVFNGMSNSERWLAKVTVTWLWRLGIGTTPTATC